MKESEWIQVEREGSLYFLYPKKKAKTLRQAFQKSIDKWKIIIRIGVDASDGL